MKNSITMISIAAATLFLVGFVCGDSDSGSTANSPAANNSAPGTQTSTLND